MDKIHKQQKTKFWKITGTWVGRKKKRLGGPVVEERTVDISQIPPLTELTMTGSDTDPALSVMKLVSEEPKKELLQLLTQITVQGRYSMKAHLTLRYRCEKPTSASEIDSPSFSTINRTSAVTLTTIDSYESMIQVLLVRAEETFSALGAMEKSGVSIRSLDSVQLTLLPVVGKRKPLLSTQTFVLTLLSRVWRRGWDKRISYGCGS